MSQAAVERVLGKLITDEPFRVRFFRDPAAASFAAGLELSKAEVDALSRLPIELIARFGACLDDRICRLPFAEDTHGISVGDPDPTPDRPPAGTSAVVDSRHPARRARGRCGSPGTLREAKRSRTTQETPIDGAPLDQDTRASSKE